MSLFEKLLGGGVDHVCVVITKTPRAPRHGETFDAGPFEPLLQRLNQQGIRRVYVDGGALIRGLFDAHLIDDVTLSVIPVLLGDGIRLFGGSEQRLDFVSSRSFASGLVQLHYRVNREVRGTA